MIAESKIIFLKYKLQRLFTFTLTSTALLVSQSNVIQPATHTRSVFWGRALSLESKDLDQRWTETFPSGLPDGEIMPENSRKRPKGMDMRQITKYRPVPVVPEEPFLHYFPIEKAWREGFRRSLVPVFRLKWKCMASKHWPCTSSRWYHIRLWNY